jgi:hypothetical protein
MYLLSIFLVGSTHSVTADGLPACAKEEGHQQPQDSSQFRNLMTSIPSIHHCWTGL